MMVLTFVLTQCFKVIFIVFAIFLFYIFSKSTISFSMVFSTLLDGKATQGHALFSREFCSKHRFHVKDIAPAPVLYGDFCYYELLVKRKLIFGRTRVGGGEIWKEDLLYDDKTFCRCSFIPYKNYDMSILSMVLVLPKFDFLSQFTGFSSFFLIF